MVFWGMGVTKTLFDAINQCFDDDDCTIESPCGELLAQSKDSYFRGYSE